MATPNITAGVTERNKPLVYRSNVVFRYENTLGVGNSFTTPIFDVVCDGRPFSEVEIGTAAIVRVPSPYFRIAVGLTGAAGNNPGGVLNVFHLQDAGTQANPFTYYVQPRAGTGMNVYRYECIGRRCQFRLANTPLGPVAALSQAFQLEIVVEG